MSLVGFGVEIACFAVGFLLGVLVARRGKRLHIDWRLQIQADEEDPGDGPQ